MQIEKRGWASTPLSRTGGGLAVEKPPKAGESRGSATLGHGDKLGITGFAEHPLGLGGVELVNRHGAGGGAVAAAAIFEHFVIIGQAQHVLVERNGVQGAIQRLKP